MIMPRGHQLLLPASPWFIGGSLLMALLVNMLVNMSLIALGFFFGGILPGASVGEALVLQYLNNVAIDYDAIKLHTEASREILAYVKLQDSSRGNPSC